jgi:tRNA(Arg) A34 adenosine deaminase TadA
VRVLGHLLNAAEGSYRGETDVCLETSILRPGAAPGRPDATRAMSGARDACPQTSAADLDRLLDVIEHEIAPLTRAGVAQGNKVFGAAILRAGDLSTVVAATNRETENPLFHGEISAINAYYAMVAADPARRHPPADSVFLSTHEPCTMCASAIAWGGFRRIFYLFSHEDSRDSFAIGHDLKILEALYRLGPGEYARENAYWRADALADAVAAQPAAAREGLEARLARIRALYAELSAAYQAGKGRSENIPLP